MKKHALCAGVALTCLIVSSPPVYAQDAVGNNSETIIVTARAGVGRYVKQDASFAISVIDKEKLRLVNPTSVADVFKAVPGFWVESSGGEASNNIRTRGIPRDGYSSVGLQEDGLPVQHDPGLGYLNADQSFRLDESINRVEAVRGGPSSIFASNAPGGVVNFITRKPGSSAEGLIKLELGDYDHYRTDFWYSTPIAEGLSAYVGGFYRENNGVRDPGFTANKGGQIRIGVVKTWDKGVLDVNYKRIDDTVGFYLPVPILSNNDGKDGVPGFDPNFGTLAGPETALLSFRNVDKAFDFDLTRGTEVKLSQWTAKLDLEVGNGWNLQNGLRYRDSDTQRNGLFPTGNIEAATVRAAGFLSSAKAAYPTTTAVKFQYLTAANGNFDMANANGNGQVVSVNALAVHVPLKEFINDFRLVKKFESGSHIHNVSVGAYYAATEFVYDRYMSTAMVDVRDNGRLLDAVAVNASGAVVGKISENGFLRYGSLFDNTQAKSRTLALYASDEWQLTEALRIDAGLRYETVKLEGSVEGKKTVDLGVAGTLADNSVITGTGVFTPISRKYDATAWTLGANYQFTPNLGVFARYTDAKRLPNGSDFTGSPLRTDIIAQPIKMSELGAKYASPMLDIFATAFFSKFTGIAFTDNIFDTATNSYRQVTAFGGSETLGLEIEGELRPTPWFDLGAALTWQDPQYKNFVYSELVSGKPVVRDFDGKQLVRVPQIGARLVPGVNFMNGAFRAQAAFEYYSDRYADNANTQKLPAYWVVNASVRYNLTDQISLYANGENLTNEIGLTEGNPRSGQFVSGEAGARYILARPILGRTLRAAITYRF
jgi:outer membrane receptor protein involved in Fe transport